MVVGGRVSGIQEIILILLIILGLFFIPRMMRKNEEVGAYQKQAPDKGFRFSGRMRLAIVGSALWVAVSVAVFQPWQKDWMLFMYIGIGPVVLAWSLKWVISGFGQKNQ
jgi:hypothetical protein